MMAMSCVCDKNDMHEGNPGLGDHGVLQGRGGGALGELCKFSSLTKSSNYFNA